MRPAPLVPGPQTQPSDVTESSEFRLRTSMADTLTIVDNRTGKKYELPIQDGTIRAMDLRQIKAAPEDFGLMTYDPAFMGTANCRSAITFIDGDKGVLLYRGYPIEQLAEESDFLETAYLILFGELPTAAQQLAWIHEITHHTMLHENIKKFMEGFQYDAHPMGIFLSTVGALSTFYPDSKQIFDKGSRLRQMHRLIAKVPSIAAYAFRHSIGRPYIYPDNDLSFTGNFLNMLFKMTEIKYQPNPVLVRAVTGKNPLIEIALELERIALQDEYFVSRKLYPNVDFYSGLIYQAIGFPVEMFPVLFAIPRTAGWTAQWEEMLLDPEQKIARPRQIYTGPEQRDYVPREKRA